MALRNSSVSVEKQSGGITSALASAAFEWLLIFLLFLEAFFAFLVTRFAHFCELQTPCLLCSRLDHIFGNEKSGFYWDLLCHEHKLEISSLVYCYTHGKLTDIRGMCKGCVSSFSAKKVTDSETDKFAVGFTEDNVDDKGNICLKVPAAIDGEELVGHSSLNDPSIGSSGLRQCFCCSQPLRTEINGGLKSQKSSGTKSTGSMTTKVHVPRSNSVAPGQRCRVSLKKRRDRSSSVSASPYLGNTGFDPLSHVGYTELKITSDSESEVPISDDDDGFSLSREASDVRVDFVGHFSIPEPRTIISEVLAKSLSSDSVIEKRIHQASVSKPSISVSADQIHVGEPDGVSSFFVVGQGSEKHKWHQSKEMNSPSDAESELLSSLGISPAISGLIVSEEPRSSSNSGKHPVEISEEMDVMKPVDTSIESDLKPDMILDEAVPSVSDCLDLNAAYKLAIANKGNHLVITNKDIAGGDEDLKLLLSQISAACGFELSWNDMVPSSRVLQPVEGVQPIEASSSIESQSQVLKKSLSIERNESGFESLDGTLIIESEGESAIDQLKRRIELDRKYMRSLYQELDEERNAAAIAASQAMAMINRLQKEKATMQMEALQYQRMMEEQAEYDQEALQKLSDLLTEKEKEVQDLEAELEDYRNGNWNELEGEQTESSRSEVGAISHNSCCGGDHHDICSIVPCDHEKTDRICGDGKGNKLGTVKNTLLDFENDQLYLMKCLNVLQKKLYVFYDNADNVDFLGVHGDMESFPDFNCGDTEKTLSNEGNAHNSVATCVVENGSCTQEKGTQGVNTEWLEEMKLNGILQRDDTQWLERQGMTQGNNQIDHDRQFHLAPTKSDLVSIAKELSNLSKRLTALEVERNFLEHSINSLQNGNEGLQFIQEIASNLRELRKIGLRSGVQSIS